LLKNLHLSRMAQELPEELQRAEKDGLAYTDLLLRLVRAQWHHRQETALEWRIRQARLPERWTLETFPFKDQPGVSKRQIMSLAQLDFIPTATNIVFIGSTGVGKSGLATGSCSRRCRTAIAPCSSRRKISSTTSTPRWPIAPPASSSIASPVSHSS